ncbi:hypothetical protein [Sphingomonas sp.]|nr:hypothetical protein [Sphingomonas sp.]
MKFLTVLLYVAVVLDAFFLCAREVGGSRLRPVLSEVDGHPDDG